MRYEVPNIKAVNGNMKYTVLKGVRHGADPHAFNTKAIRSKRASSPTTAAINAILCRPRGSDWRLTIGTVPVPIG